MVLYLEIDPDMRVINNIQPVADYVSKTKDMDILLDFSQGVNRLRLGGDSSEDLGKVVEQLQRVHDSIPISERARESAYVLLLVAKERLAHF